MRLLYFIAFLLMAGCSSPAFIQTALPEGSYTMKLDSASKGEIHFVNDTALWITNNSQQSFSDFISPYSKLVLAKSSFDLDLFTMPFKLRPARNGIPTQLNTTFNGGFYFGYRKDHFLIDKKLIAQGLSKQTLRRYATGFGGVLGLGSVFMNPTFLQDAITYEYDALVIQYGIAGLIGYEGFTSGLAFGADWLPDKNKDKWIYQHKPWIGLFVGININ